MKRQLLNAFIVIGFIVAATAAAQAQGVRRMVVNVPFDFVVGKRTLPAGTYTFKQLTRDNDKPLLLQSADRRTTQIVLTNPVEAAASAETVAQLDFRRYGDKYFLARVWSAGQNTGRELSKSPLELVTIRELARGASGQETAQPQTVSVKGRLE